MKSRDLLELATKLVANSTAADDVFLRRAQSSIYYALFHFLSRESADLIVGADPAERSKHAWHQVYRALDHQQARKRCADNDFTKKFGLDIQNFANAFFNMQTKRHSADYDVRPSGLTASKVTADIENSWVVIERFSRASEKDRRAFSAYVLFAHRAGHS